MLDVSLRSAKRSPAGPGSPGALPALPVRGRDPQPVPREEEAGQRNSCLPPRFRLRSVSADVRAAEMTDNAVSLPFKSDRLEQASQPSEFGFGSS